jgi:hypothetical protein
MASGGSEMPEAGLRHVITGALDSARPGVDGSADGVDLRRPGGQGLAPQDRRRLGADLPRGVVGVGQMQGPHIADPVTGHHHLHLDGAVGRADHRPVHVRRVFFFGCAGFLCGPRAGRGPGFRMGRGLRVGRGRNTILPPRCLPVAGPPQSVYGGSHSGLRHVTGQRGAWWPGLIGGCA